MGFELKNLKTADGKPVSLEGVDAKVVGLLEVVGTALTAQVEQSVAGVGETVKAAVAEAIKPVSEQVEAIKKAAPNPEPKPNDKPEPEMPAWAKAMMEKVDGLATERAAEKEHATVAGSVKAYLDKNLPNLGGSRGIIERRLLAMKPKDEAAIKAAVEEIRNEYKEAGVDVKRFDADPKGEGAKDEPKDDAEKLKNEKLAGLKEEAAKFGR